VPRHVDVEHHCRDHGVTVTPGTGAAVDAARRELTTAGGQVIPYERLLLAPGARPALPYANVHVLGFGRLPDTLARDSAGSVAIVVPPGTSWTLPAYELAVLAAAGGTRSVTVHTPEAVALEAFGPGTTRAVGDFLGRHGVQVATGTVTEIGTEVDDLADTVVALPILNGPTIAGLPLDRRGFVRVDGTMAVSGLADVYAAGDATDHAIKQGGLAAQQADAAANAIVRSCGGSPPAADEVPVLRGKMTAPDGEELYLRRALQGAHEGEVDDLPLWRPPSVVCAWRLARWLEHRQDDEPEPRTLDHVSRPRTPVPPPR
jgi:sulfide:quinone oxidoreductase